MYCRALPLWVTWWGVSSTTTRAKRAIEERSAGESDFLSEYFPSVPTFPVESLAEQVAAVEGAPAVSPGFNYFKTSDSETMAVQGWMEQMQALSDAGKAPDYDVMRQNCATFCIAGLVKAGAIRNEGISLIPNRLYMLLAPLAMENWTWEGRSKPKPDPEADRKKRTGPACLKNRDGTCVQ